MSNLNRRRGKDLERSVSKDLGGRRVGILGHEDVRLHWGASVECKERKKLPVFVTNCMAQAEKSADGDMALVVLHEFGDDHEKDIVMCRLKDFKVLIQHRGEV